MVEVTPGSPADVQGGINYGDSLLTINKKYVSEDTDIKAITKAIENSGNIIKMRLSTRPIVPGEKSFS